jgi:hypothetical protein
MGVRNLMEEVFPKVKDVFPAVTLEELSEEELISLLRAHVLYVLKQHIDEAHARALIISLKRKAQKK